MSSPIELAVAIVAAMLFGIAIAVIIMSIKRLRHHVSTGNSNDGLHQNSSPPPANHAVEFYPESDSAALFPSWLGSHQPTRTNGSPNGGSGLGSTANYFPQQLFVLREDTAGNVPLEEPPGNHPHQNTQPTPMWAFVNRRQLRNTSSLNSYLYEHPTPRIINSRLDGPLIVAANNAFLPGTPVYLMPIRGGLYNGESNREPLPMEEPHSKDVFPVPPSPTPETRPGPTREPSSKSLRDFSGTIFEYEELERAANGFSQKDNFLGSGAFGSVYRGVLSNGTEIAVKRLRPDSQRAEQEFQAEVDTISHIRYKHLVSMIGCCLHGDERLLVYEFVPNNTLHYHLHGNKKQTMDWPTRVKIAQGAAKGLTYLHETCLPRIIHRDIKACNILIDSEFNAKVADFGLAKLFPGSFTHITTQLAGTFGYMDPEYYGSGQLTEKSDVYSFGVMLLELITGRKPRGLALWAKGESPVEEHNYESLVDPQLQGNFNAEEMVRMVACAAACTRRCRRLRPSMSQVERILNGEGSPVELNRSINQFVDNSIGQYDGDLKKFWKNAFLSPNNTTINVSGLSVNSTY